MSYVDIKVVLLCWVLKPTLQVMQQVSDVTVGEQRGVYEVI